jgi:SAM-dependent methyltransferase
MGLDANGTQCVLFAKALGVEFHQVATIGRQGLHLTPDRMMRNLARFGVAADAATTKGIFSSADGFAEEFLRLLGAEKVDSFDHSPFEGATCQHDMNCPIEDRHKGRYSLVLDSGCLEHVFNFPLALKNCMEMVRPGGHYLSITPANNFMGHGFYQFSPELFFGAFSEKNGFELVALIAFEDAANARWHLVTRPVHAYDRVELTSRRPIYLCAVARRLHAVEPLTEMPQQSDYVHAWRHDESDRHSPATPTSDAGGSPVALLARAARPWLSELTRHLAWLVPFRTRFSPRHFEPLALELGREGVSQATRNLALRAEGEALRRKLRSYVYWRIGLKAGRRA